MTLRYFNVICHSFMMRSWFKSKKIKIKKFIIYKFNFNLNLKSLYAIKYNKSDIYFYIHKRNVNTVIIVNRLTVVAVVYNAESFTGCHDILKITSSGYLLDLNLLSGIHIYKPICWICSFCNFWISCVPSA